MSEACGFALLDKPTGKSSHHALGALKRALGTRRVGHAGTLDPLATGVLVTAAGKATRLLGYAEAADKEYLVALRLGVVTDSLDTDGEVVGGFADRIPAAIDWPSLLPRFVGEQWQKPPAVSAIKIDGTRACDRVRRGEEIDLPPRLVRIDAIELADVLPLLGTGARPDDICLRVRCSKGTYVRSLVRDIGERLGCGACVAALRRTAVGGWRLPDAPTEASDSVHCIPVDQAFPDWPRFDVFPEGLPALRNGNRIACPLADAHPVLALGADGRPLAMGKARTGIFHCEVLLVDPDEIAAPGTGRAASTPSCDAMERAPQATDLGPELRASDALSGSCGRAGEAEGAVGEADCARISGDSGKDAR